VIDPTSVKRHKYREKTRQFFLCVSFSFSCIPRLLMADDLQWQVEAYGGKYYGSDRAALYGAYTQPLNHNVSVMLEILHESLDSYLFQGIGGHILWQLTDELRVGVVGSNGSENYPIEFFFGDTLSSENSRSYDLSTGALEAEYIGDSFSISLQGGRAYSEVDSIGSRGYTSIDAYYWGKSSESYLRAVDQRTSSDHLTFVEGYREWNTSSLPTTAYMGASAGVYDAIYAGAYFGLAEDNLSSWVLDAGVGHADGKWQLQLELNIFLGPGANGPAVSAFGFTIGD
jgi:hypothetical protein